MLEKKLGEIGNESVDEEIRLIKKYKHKYLYSIPNRYSLLVEQDIPRHFGICEIVSLSRKVLFDLQNNYMRRLSLFETGNVLALPNA